MSRPQPDPQAIHARVTEVRTLAMVQQQHKESGQSAQASNVSSASLNNMFRDASVVQQIMTGLNDAVSEEQKIVAITKTVMKLVNSNGC
jgi:hydroxyethylthiazole kinase-like sugar kinase family protein